MINQTKEVTFLNENKKVVNDKEFQGDFLLETNMATKQKGGKDKKGSKKEKIVEEPPPPAEEKKEEEQEEKPEDKTPEEPAPQEEEPPKEPTPSPVYDEPTLTELIVECYEGERSRGLYDGEGVAYFNGSHDYKGQFSQGLMHGKGKYTWADGVSYEGDFLMNRVTGRGMYKWPDGSTYEGEVYEGFRNGHGTFRSMVSPCSYTGQWQMGKRHGTGIMRYDTDGLSFYEGDWVNNLRHGYGVRRYRSGNVYEGEWANNNRQGQGTMRWIDLDQAYTGQWENGIQHGHGEHTWYLKRVPGSQYPLRNQYVGDFVRGMRHGVGSFYFANGAKYEGEWDSNLKQGRGKFTFKNGRIFEGMFIQDRMMEYPQFRMDGVTTPDITQIRTQTPDPVGPRADIGDDVSVISNESRNTLGPSLTLDIDHLLDEFSEEDREEELKQVMFVILRHITLLKKVYNFYAGLGHDASPDNTFIMTRLQFWRFLKDCQFHHRDTTLAEMDRLLAGAGTPNHSIHSPLDKLLLREYLNHVITLSFYLFQDEHPGKDTLLSWCLNRAIQENIVRFACTVNGTFLHDPRRAVNALGYMDKCWEIFQSVCKPRKYYPHEPTLKMREFLFMVEDYNLINDRLTPKHILEILADDNPAVYDGEDCNLELEMVFLEFFEALIGCSVVFVTEDLLKDPNTPRPSTVMSHMQTSYSGTTQATSRASGILEDNADDQGTTGGGSPQRTTLSPETSSPQLRAVSSADMTQKLSTDVSSTKHEHHGHGSAAVSTHTDIQPGSSHTQLHDTKAGTKSEPSIDHKGAQSSHSLVTAHSSDHQPLLQSMLSMGGQTDMEPDEEDLEEEEMDEDVRQFNFWTHQINIFLIYRLFPSFEHTESVRLKKDEIRAEKLAAAIEAQKLKEEQEKRDELIKEAARLAAVEAALKERAVSGMSEISKDGEGDTNTRTVSEAKT
ncbi:radial spoke head 10 homolog B-like [Glandiceps talaboti]